MAYEDRPRIQCGDLFSTVGEPFAYAVCQNWLIDNGWAYDIRTDDWILIERSPRLLNQLLLGIRDMGLPTP